MGDLFYWYFIGVLACIPYVFYDMGMYLVNESYSKVGVSRGQRFFAFFFYLFICLGAWAVFVLDTLAFVCDMIVGIKRIGRNRYEKERIAGE
jgi:hypothetical protein